MTQSDPEDVLRFWLEEKGPEDWYKGGEALDAEIRDRFEGTWEAARAGRLAHWTTSPRGALAFLILTDQFPRNMFRGEAKAFATDPKAREVAKFSIDRKFDLKVDEPARQFFYLPLEHSECLQDQERAVRLICERMDAPETLLHARAHREVIRCFGRFPFRNAALGREMAAREAVFMDEGGYGAVVRELKEG
ncbi:DUF924 domain-containing protein [Jannaschia sp. Os4]|uniref:DUF924 family protein n=1 Tax=Jannaschia sp. Os4 TaxID=2807617 RepID=UPI00193A34A4|nr:DUF924 family protein [Jannaschia sp. Os4]MBM2576883.1 DUF924 domain-containing protein [Jannaschia sp. Os4]